MTATATSEKPAMEIDPALKDAGGDLKIVSLRSAKNPSQAVRVPAFRINGTTYTMLTRPKTNAGLRYVHIARTQGREAAVDFMLDTLLGEGYQALMAFDDLTEDDLLAVVTAASRIMTGAAEAPKGKRSNGSRRSAG